jgi:membrane-bound lytic murein transglycosylase D
MFKIFPVFFLCLNLFSCASQSKKSNPHVGRHQWFQNMANENQNMAVTNDEELIQQENEIMSDSQEVVEELNSPHSHKVVAPEEKQYLTDIIPSAKYFLKDIPDNKVDFWIKYFTVSNRDRFQRFINNGQKYKSIISDIFKENGLPEDLFFVGLIESGYYLGAKSTASAVGPWQFIRSTGKAYGLTVNQQLDERRSIHKATQAAAFYFKDLYNIFGSWELALSAYNAGENGIIRRIRKGNSRDYYQLSQNDMLPKETMHYVPKVRAVIHIYNNLNKYNFHLPQESDLFANTKEITIKHSYKISNIARQAGLSIDQLRSLNPDLIGSYIPKMNKGIQLRVPNKNFDLASIKKEHSLNATESELLAQYKIKRGDTLYSIARKHRINTSKIMQLNGLNQKTKLRVGQILKLQPSKTESAQRVIASTSEKSSFYTVKPGDNLSSIAKKMKLTIADLKSNNKINKNTVFVGQKLYLSKNSQIAIKTNHRNNTYRVQPGDNLDRIARRFKINKTSLMSANGLSTSTIYPGQKLIIKNEI